MSVSTAQENTFTTFATRNTPMNFVRQVKDQRVQVHYESANPNTSVILDRDLEMIALLAPQFR